MCSVVFATLCAVPGTILTTSTDQLGCIWPPGYRHEWERVQWGCLEWDLTRNDSFQTTEDALNSLDSKEVEGEALEDGEDEEQVHKGSGCDILTTIIRFRLKLTCL